MESQYSHVRCPYCDAADAEMISLFGQQLLTVQYYCNSCRTPFERLKGQDILSDARAHAHQEENVHGDRPPSQNEG